MPACSELAFGCKDSTRNCQACRGGFDRYDLHDPSSQQVSVSPFAVSLYAWLPETYPIWLNRTEDDDADSPEEDHLTWIEALYWVVVTGTTVGFGDYSAETDDARLFAAFYLPFIVVFTGLREPFVLVRDCWKLSCMAFLLPRFLPRCCSRLANCHRIGRRHYEHTAK